MKHRNLALAVLIGCGLLSAGFVFGTLVGPAKEFTPRGYTIEKEVTVPLTPEAAYDAFTGDITPWWDHTFSGKPKKLVIEAKPGGQFMEIFDDAGNGVVHATVTWAERGKKLAFRGALGPFHSLAVNLMHTITFEKVEGGTKIKASIHCEGELAAGSENGLNGAWDHFLLEAFKPYAEKLAAKKGN